jgi:hypothetical protein
MKTFLTNLFGFALIVGIIYLLMALGVNYWWVLGGIWVLAIIGAIINAVNTAHEKDQREQLTRAMVDTLARQPSPDSYPQGSAQDVSRMASR